MINTEFEKEIVLKLFKDFKSNHNSTSLARNFGKSRVGSFKALNKLSSENLVKFEIFGKSKYYGLNFSNDVALKSVELFLLEERESFRRWVDELEGLAKYAQIIILFGSFVKNSKTANDLDLLLIFDEKNTILINNYIAQKNRMLVKKIHPIKQTMNDFRKNLQNNNKVLLNSLNEGVVLSGVEKLVELVKNVAFKEQS